MNCVKVYLDKWFSVRYVDEENLDPEFDFKKYDSEGEGTKIVREYHYRLLCRIATTNFDPAKLKFFATLGNKYALHYGLDYCAAVECYKCFLDDMCTSAMDKRDTLDDMTYFCGEFIDSFDAATVIAEKLEKEIKEGVDNEN